MSFPNDECLIREVVATSNTIKEAVLKLSGKCTNNEYKIFRYRCIKYNISTSHFVRQMPVDPGTGYRERYSIEEALVANSTYQNIAKLKQRIVREGLLKYQCVVCNNDGEWLGNPISLQLDHKNGVRNDHRIENLRFLCPNCHTQTTTYAGKNQKRK